MQEPAVFERVVDELEARGYRPLVHVPGSHADAYASVLDRCESHRIAIGGRYPDVLGFTATDRVFAVEVKGDSGLLKGIGQALVYQQGSHASYLAADATAVAPHSDLLRTKGVGVIGVEDRGVTRWASPTRSESLEAVADIEGQLSIRLRRSEIGGRIGALSLAQPLNFLAPVVAIRRRGPLATDELDGALRGEYGFGATSAAQRGAETLGLIAAGDSGTYRLTDQGDLVGTTLLGCGIERLDDLRLAKESVRGSTVIDERRPLGVLLRNCYARHPEFRLFLEALRRHGDRVEFPALLETTVRRYPNVFLGLFCTRRGRERARKLIERGQTARLYDDPDVWRDVVRSNVLFNFVQQLKHVGVLAPETRSHSGPVDEYDPAAKPWILRR